MRVGTCRLKKGSTEPFFSASHYPNLETEELLAQLGMVSLKFQLTTARVRDRSRMAETRSGSVHESPAPKAGAKIVAKDGRGEVDCQRAEDLTVRYSLRDTLTMLCVTTSEGLLTANDLNRMLLILSTTIIYSQIKMLGRELSICRNKV
jgi:hypothetical protein